MQPRMTCRKVIHHSYRWWWLWRWTYFWQVVLRLHFALFYSCKLSMGYSTFSFVQMDDVTRINKWHKALVFDQKSNIGMIVYLYNFFSNGYFYFWEANESEILKAHVYIILLYIHVHQTDIYVYVNMQVFRVVNKRFGGSCLHKPIRFTCLRF